MDLSAIDVQQKTFRERFRGYDPDDVEDFLDRVVETLRGQELKLRQHQEELDALTNDLAGSKEAEEAIKRTYISAQRTSQEMVAEAQEKASRILDKAKAEADTLVSDARAEAGRQRKDASAEHDALTRRVSQLRSAVGDLQTRLKAFAETAAVELEGLGASIDLETHSISEILESAASEDAKKGGKTKKAAATEPRGDQPEGKQEEAAPAESSDAKAKVDETREAAYLQQPRGQRPWERT